MGDTPDANSAVGGVLLDGDAPPRQSGSAVDPQDSGADKASVPPHVVMSADDGVGAGGGADDGGSTTRSGGGASRPSSAGSAKSVKSAVYQPALSPFHKGPAGVGGGTMPVHKPPPADGAGGGGAAGAGGGGAGTESGDVELVGMGEDEYLDPLPPGLYDDKGVQLATPRHSDHTIGKRLLLRQGERPDHPPRSLVWSDEQGFALFQVFYSDRLHYSEDTDYDDYPATPCCVVM